MSRPVSLNKLSQLQRLILVMLLDERVAGLRRKEFRLLAKQLYWGRRASPNVAAADLSRAMSSLEGRGLLTRSFRSWELSTDEVAKSGYVFALIAWKQKKDLYEKLGLRPPSFGSTPPQRKGVTVQLRF